MFWESVGPETTDSECLIIVAERLAITFSISNSLPSANHRYFTEFPSRSCAWLFLRNYFYFCDHRMWKKYSRILYNSTNVNNNSEYTKEYYLILTSNFILHKFLILRSSPSIGNSLVFRSRAFFLLRIILWLKVPRDMGSKHDRRKCTESPSPELAGIKPSTMIVFLIVIRIVRY